jgi:CDP-diacylglycerol---glycerol-3-phosphate 3-phosphatidyltransferase
MMAPGTRWTIPNIITLVRIVVAPGVFFLALQPSVSARFGAFLLFLAAALSDVWDGYLARKYGWITDMGKLLDPLADKLLLLATFIPFYMISHRPDAAELVPWWGPLPIWVLLVIFGRELAVTLLRSYAQRQGVVIAAGKGGKQKALFQNMFVGGLLLWYALLQHAIAKGWVGSGGWAAWSLIHRGFIGLTLAIAVVLTVVSGVDYFLGYTRRARPTAGSTA